MGTRDSTLSRRALLTATGAATLTATAGCTAVVDWIGDQVLKDVNVLNQLDRPVEGTVTVSGPEGDDALAESFAVGPLEGEEADSNAAVFPDVWDAAGEYRVTVRLSETAVEGVTTATETVRIERPDEEMLAIPIGTDASDAPIGFLVATEFSEFGRE
jgi:hypothetical protein